MFTFSNLIKIKIEQCIFVIPVKILVFTVLYVQETLAEVLGIKEKYRLHIKDKEDKVGQLTEQIAEKDKLIACLNLKLKNYVESLELDQEARMKSIEQREEMLKATEATICKVKQKITLFVDDVVTLCLREPMSRQVCLNC